MKPPPENLDLIALALTFLALAAVAGAVFATGMHFHP